MILWNAHCFGRNTDWSAARISMKRSPSTTFALVGLSLALLAQQAPCQTPNGTKPQVTPKSPSHPQTSGELDAWQAAKKVGTPEAYKDFYQKYPHSAHIKVAQGTLRGRYWEVVLGSDNRDGVLVTVEGMNVLESLSVNDAIRLEVIGTSPWEPGAKFTKSGRTFDYVYGEICKGGSTSSSGAVKLILEPRDYLDSTIILSADEKRLLSWDLSNAHLAEQLSEKCTFIEAEGGAVFAPPGNGSGAWHLDKDKTPESQEFSVHTELPR